MPTYKNINHITASAGKSSPHQEEGKNHKIISRDGKFNYESGDAVFESDMDSESDYVNCRESNKKVRHLIDH